jgi:hypothetical protein
VKVTLSGPKICASRMWLESRANAPRQSICRGWAPPPLDGRFTACGISFGEPERGSASWAR